MALPARVEAGLRDLAGIPSSRVEALRRLVSRLREARVLASETDADRGGVETLVDAALEGARRELQREEARQLAAAVYQPEVQ